MTLASNNSPTVKVPIRIHLVKSKNVSLNTSDDVSLEETIRTVNQIWSQAGIVFYSHETVFHKAEHVGEYMRIISNIESTQKQKVQALRAICPKPKSPRIGVDICIIGNSFKPNHGGVAFRNGKFSPMVIWPLTSNNSKSHNPATLAHELGHTLGLKHSGVDDIYLMRGQGYNIRRVGMYSEIKLTQEEIFTARKYATKLGK